MEVLTLVSCVASFFFSLGVLHGKKPRKKEAKVMRDYPRQERLDSTDLLGD